MILAALIAVALVACGWLVGWPWAIPAIAIVPVVSIIGALHTRAVDGQYPETWITAAVLFTVAGGLCVGVGLLGRRAGTRPRHRRP